LHKYHVLEEMKMENQPFSQSSGRTRQVDDCAWSIRCHNQSPVSDIRRCCDSDHTQQYRRHCTPADRHCSGVQYSRSPGSSRGNVDRHRCRRDIFWSDIATDSTDHPSHSYSVCTCQPSNTQNTTVARTLW